MSYENLFSYFKKLWGPTLQGTRTKAAQADLDWRTKMAKRSVKERYMMADEVYYKLEKEEHEKNKEKYDN